MIASMLRSLAVLVTVGVAVAACSSPGASSAWSYGPSLPPAAASGSGAPSAAASGAAPSASAAAASASAGPSAAGEVTNLTIGTKTGDELGFDPDEVSVPAGAQVKITFENRSALPHNLTFKDPITAATDPVVAPGASATVEFTAPAPGDYAWSCTIHPGMEGKLTVEPAT
jgi:plastocyanin